MYREEARQEIRKNWRQLMRVMNAGEAKQRVNGEKSYICPLCGHGKGGDGLTHNPRSKDGYGLKCFGCDFSGDIIDLYEQYSGADYNAALQVLADELGITIEKQLRDNQGRHYDTPNPAAQKSRAFGFDDEVEEPTDTPENAQGAPASPSFFTGEEEPADDPKPAGTGAQTAEQAQAAKAARAFIESCAGVMKGSPAEAYIKNRGFTDEIIKEIGLGYYQPMHGVVIPYPGKDYYIVRRMDKDGEGKYYKPKADELGAEPLFLIGDPADGLLICEGQLDAIALYQAGAAAVAATGGAGGRKHLEALEGLKKAVIISDNDEPGRKNAGAVKKILDARGVVCTNSRPPEDCKDINDALLKHGAARVAGFVNSCKEWFSKTPEPKDNPLQEMDKQLDEFLFKLRDALRITGFDHDATMERRAQGIIKSFWDSYFGKETAPTIQPADNIQNYINEFMTDDIGKFKYEIKTGFNNLDKETGGLYPGLYVVAAISSLGKTTFCHQLSDQLAKQGHHVLFFSMEMSRLEMVTKSLARKTAQTDFENAVTSLAIRKGYLPPQVMRAKNDYLAEVGDRISIIEGDPSTTVSYIRRYLMEYIERTGARPVVFVDYLQIIPPEKDERGRTQSIKENVDNAVTTLRQLCRDLYLTIFAISSVNRGNYLTPIDFESLKESGGIEYGADAVWGLQLQCLNDDLFDKQGDIKKKREVVRVAKNDTPRKIELLALKNRTGNPSFRCYYNYYSKYDLFTEDAAADFKEEPAADKKKITRRL